MVFGYLAAEDIAQLVVAGRRAADRRDEAS